MDSNQQKEQFSVAYVRAVVATAGFVVSKPEPDVDSIDLTVAMRGGCGTVRSPKLDLQLKCTSQECLDEDRISYPLKLKNYDELRSDDVQVPRALVVVLVPADVQEWLVHSEKSLALHNCGYWVSMRGRPASENTSNITIYAPRQQQFTVEGLRAIMDRLSAGGVP